MTILVTGAAGFIGFHLCKRLLNDGEEVVGIDNINDYYDPELKNSRLNILTSFNGKLFSFFKGNLEDQQSMKTIFLKHKPKVVINLAAQAGVRYSLENPKSYIDSNLVGFINILEECRRHNIEHLIYASSSSVYGGNTKMPFSESDNVDHPVSIYAATKKSNELMAHSYSHLYGLPTTGLRFFTVYGPWGRPDMAPMIFAKSILKNESIKVFNYGEMERDFTYIDDVVEGIIRCCYKEACVDENFNPLNPNPSTSLVPYRIFNIGNSNPVNLTYFIELLEKNLGKKAIKDMQPMQPGDVASTAAKMDLLSSWVGYKPSTSIEQGISLFSKWYLDYFQNTY